MTDFPNQPPTMDGISAKKIESARISTRVLFSGDESATPVIFVHGNLSSATFWEEMMLALPAGFRGIALDQRGYGGSDPAKKIDATRGVSDLADDLAALMDALGIEQAHFVGHSLGGAVLWRFMIDYAERCLSITQAAPGSPYGFGGCKGLDGALNHPDGAGSGAGIVSADFVAAVAAHDTSNAPNSPRFIMNNFYWTPSYKSPREDVLLESMLSTHIGDEDYRGDAKPSVHWPMVAPGRFGPNNALSPLYRGDITPLYRLDPKPPVLWIRGANDQIVSDMSLSEMGTLGKMGAVPGWPGEEVFPPQPMVAQTRAVLEEYARNGGRYQEVVLDNCGHTAYLEQAQAFNEAFHAFLAANS